MPSLLFFIDENVRVGFGMDPDEKLNKANCLPSLKQIQNQNYEILNEYRKLFCIHP